MELRYGDSSFILPPRTLAVAEVVRAALPDPGATAEELVRRALRDSATTLDRFAAGGKVVIITSDITRHTGSEIYLPILVAELNRRGIADRDITILIALGIHRRQTEAEHRKILGPLFGRIAVVDHDCDDPGKLVTVGITSSGVPVEVNRAAADADRLILTGTIGFHYFAGFGGGRKAVLPGIASRRSCMASHFLVLNPGEGSGKNERATTGNMDRNPVHLAMDEACAMLDPDLLLNTVMAPDKRMLAAFAGGWRETFERGSRFYGDRFSFPLPVQGDLVIVSCGGFPKDINLIQAHKSMEYGAKALREGGVMILLAECRDGYGNATFFDWFAHADLAAFEAALRKRYEINGQTAYSLLQKALTRRIILVSSLPVEEVAAMRMIPASSLEEALAAAKPHLPADPVVYVIPEGGSVLPVVQH